MKGGFINNKGDNFIVKIYLNFVISDLCLNKFLLQTLGMSAAERKGMTT